jgi:predicted CopG family antitoxin
MSSGYKPITVREDVYNSLDRMKDKTNRSFSDVIEALTDEKDKIIEENKRLIDEKDKIIEKLIKEKDNIIEENQRLYKDIGDKGKGFFGSLIKR